MEGIRKCITPSWLSLYFNIRCIWIVIYPGDSAIQSVWIARARWGLPRMKRSWLASPRPLTTLLASTTCVHPGNSIQASIFAKISFILRFNFGFVETSIDWLNSMKRSEIGPTVFLALRTFLLSHYNLHGRKGKGKEYDNFDWKYIFYESRGGSSDFRLQTSDLRLHTSNFRLQTWQSSTSGFLISDRWDSMLHG